MLNSKPQFVFRASQAQQRKGNPMKSTKSYALIAATLMFAVCSQGVLAGSGQDKAAKAAARKKQAAAIAAQKALEKAPAYKAGGKPGKEKPRPNLD